MTRAVSVQTTRVSANTSNTPHMPCLLYTSKAAESLGYSQSAVTVQIKALEEELGVRLFDRMGKRVILTAQEMCIRDRLCTGCAEHFCV